MIIYEKSSRFAFHILHEAKSKVRISENAYKNSGNLQIAPMQRTFDALKDFISITASFKVNKILCVATSALRDAPNKHEFTNRVRKELGLHIKVINGEKEAYLGAIACANLLPPYQDAITIDIGGGSTEFALINGKNVSHTISLDLGTVRLKELFLDKEQLSEAVAYIDEELKKLDGLSASNLIGIGGTFRAISTAIMEYKCYPLERLHGFECEHKEFTKFIGDVLSANEAKLKKLGIKSDRYDVIKPGALILDRVIKKLALTKMITSGVGVREGAYLSDLLRNSRDRFPENYNVSVRYLLDTHIKDANFSNNLNKIVKEIFDLTHEYLKIDPKYKLELRVAAKLYPIGSAIHFFSKNRHSYYMIQSALEYGFTHKQTTLIATLVRFARKKMPSSLHVQKYASLLPDVKTLEALSYILSLGVALLTHRPKNIDFSFEFTDGELRVISDSSLYLSRDAVKSLDEIKKLNVVL